MSVQVAKPAPKFSMDAFSGEDFARISLDDYRGKWVVLFFYPLDFTFVCPTEIKAFSQAHEEFTKRNAVVLGCSVDSKHCHKAWVNNGLGKIKFPLLSDLNHKVSREYDVLDEDAGEAQRGTFIIDPEGVLRWKVVHDTNVGRNIDEVLRVLEALQAGGLCAANWIPGQQLING
jgi:peroxiredoxin 2/4